MLSLWAALVLMAGAATALPSPQTYSGIRGTSGAAVDLSAATIGGSHPVGEDIRGGGGGLLSRLRKPTNIVEMLRQQHQSQQQQQQQASTLFTRGCFSPSCDEEDEEMHSVYSPAAAKGYIGSGEQGMFEHSEAAGHVEQSSLNVFRAMVPGPILLKGGQQHAAPMGKLPNQVGTQHDGAARHDGPLLTPCSWGRGNNRSRGFPFLDPMLGT